MFLLTLLLGLQSFVSSADGASTICASPPVVTWFDPSRFRGSLINADRFFSFNTSLVIGRVAEDSYNQTAPYPGRLNYSVTATAQDPFSAAFHFDQGAVNITHYGEYINVDLFAFFHLGSAQVWHFEVTVFDDSNPLTHDALSVKNGTLVRIDGKPGQTANFSVLDPAEYWHNRTQSQMPGGSSNASFPSNEEWGNCSCAFRETLLAPVSQANLSILFDPSAGQVVGSNTENDGMAYRMPDGPLDPTEKERTVSFNVQIRLFYLHSDGSRFPLRYVLVVLDDDILGGFQTEVGSDGTASGVWRSTIPKTQRLPTSFQPRSRFIFFTYSQSGFRIVTAAKATDSKTESWIAASLATCSSSASTCLLDFTLDWNAYGGVGTLWHHLSNIWESTTGLLGTDDIPAVDVWFPASDAKSGGYFNSDSEFIAISTSSRDEPDVIAHEYGHYFQYIIMGHYTDFKNLKWTPPVVGGTHSFCQANPQSAADAWSEGYATAFGLRVQEKVPTFSWTTSPDITMRGVSIENFKCNSQKDMKFSEGRVAAGLWDVMDFAAGENDPANGVECNGGDESLGATGHCDRAGLGPAKWVLRDPIQGKHAGVVDDWVTSAVPSRGQMGKDWLESMQYNYYLGSSGLAGILKGEEL